MEGREQAEFGAYALAFLIVSEHSEYNVIEQAVIGTDFDFWLGHDSSHPHYDPHNFLKARLEVSGILKGENTLINRRLNRKIRQVSISDKLNIPAIIIICEFSKPISVIFVK